METMSSAERPWLAAYHDVPTELDYPALTLYHALQRSATRVPQRVALDFLGRTTTFSQLGRAIDRCANALAALGLGVGDRIAIAVPNCPQGVIAFYAANRLGAVPVMIHPLAAATEVEHYLISSRARFALVLDATYGTFAAARERTGLETVLVARIADYLGPLSRLGFQLTQGRKVAPVPRDPGTHKWGDVMRAQNPAAPPPVADPDHLAVILFSGGTTGASKGIMLSNRNLVSEGMQVASWVRMSENDAILAIMPLFHGFGLAVCVNAPLLAGCAVHLVPTFTPQSVARLIDRKRPTLMVGVPTLFAALTRESSLRRSDLSSLRATFCGADTLPRPVKERFEQLIAERGGHVSLLEGYGLSEAVSGIMAMPPNQYREGSIGVPFPDMLAKICHPGTSARVSAGEEGEICVAGPAVMMGYLDDPEATASALRTHDDGRVWLHTGDLGRMDEDGFFYFTCRLKRIIKSSGFNVFPVEVEAVLLQHPVVAEACVVGVPDEGRVERVKAFVVLKSPEAAGPELANALITHCRQHLLKWCCPRQVEFRRELPKTRVGKIDFLALAREAAGK
jgi:long-chain acyl-CoA synthetase